MRLKNNYRNARSLCNNNNTLLCSKLLNDTTSTRINPTKHTHTQRQIGIYLIILLYYVTYNFNTPDGYTFRT